MFLKYPNPGTVKTRIAKTLGDLRACEIYRILLDRTLSALQSGRNEFDLIGYYTGSDEADFEPWRDQFDRMIKQPDGDLGDRLQFLFNRFTDSHCPVMAIGTDCPEITIELINEAIRMIEASSVAIGPTTDGGYYLIGTDSYVDGMFDRIRWSTAETLADQTSAIERCGLKVQTLNTLSDIDEWDDWLKYEERLGKNS